jgi:mRNA interferase RelE/StbE
MAYFPVQVKMTLSASRVYCDFTTVIDYENGANPVTAATPAGGSPRRYNIDFKPSAKESLGKIPQPHRQRIATRIDRLAENPRPRGVKKLSDKERLYRIRVGDYRVVYRINDDILLVLVVRVGSRGDVYCNLL